MKMPLTLKQLQLRQNMLTATDMVALVGASTARSEMDVYQSKVAAPIAALPEPPRPGSPADMGNRMEKFLARIYADLTEPTEGAWKIYSSPVTYQHPVYPWAGATPDRFIIEGDVAKDQKKSVILSGKASHLLECKLVGSFMGKNWDLREVWMDDADRLPESVYIQCQWQMWVTGYNRCDVAALLYGTRFRSFTLELDKPFIQRLMAVAEAFWETHVLPRVPPPPDGSNSYQRWLEGRIGPPVGDSTVTAPPEAEDWAIRYAAAAEIEKQARKEKKKAIQYLQMHLGQFKKMRGGWGSAVMVEKVGSISIDKVCAEIGLKEKDFDYLQNDPSYHVRVFPSKLVKDNIDETTNEVLADIARKGRK